MTELTSEVIAFDYDGEGNLTNLTYYPTLPEDFSLENKGSAIKISMIIDLSMFLIEDKMR